MSAQEGNVSFHQIRTKHRLGEGTRAQSADGTFTAGNLPMFSETTPDGQTTDSGILAANVALKSGIQQETYIAGIDTGSANAYAVTLTPTPTVVTYSAVVFKVGHANTGASTLSVNGGPAKAIKKQVTKDLELGDWLTNQIVFVIYDGTNWQWVGGGGFVTTGAGGPWVMEVPTGALNGTNPTFTLLFAPTTGSLTLFLNIQQREGTDFTITGNTITFTVPPKHRDTGWFQARYQKA